MPGPVKSLMNVFAVPKVKDPISGKMLDVCPVYDGTKSGLNSAVWAPSFWMPSMETLFQMVDFDSWLGDIDLGEMFLNFPLDPKIRAYAGVDLTGFVMTEERGSRQVVWEQWCWMLMGSRPSPFVAICLNLWGKEIIHADRMDPTNIFIRGAGYSLEVTWHVLHRVAALANYLGIQDAPHKQCSPLKTEARAWTRALQKIFETVIIKLTSQQKWDKAKRFIWGLLEHVRQGEPLSYKMLLKERGFLMYLTMTYPILTPYMKGLHLTVDSWQKGRDDEGWWMTRSHLEAALAALGEEVADAIPVKPEAPEFVEPVPCLMMDLQSLEGLTESEQPIERVICAKTIIHIVHGFGDASGTGFFILAAKD